MLEDKYKWIEERQYLDDFGYLTDMLKEFCENIGLYEFEKVACNLNSIQDVIVRVHKRRHYFKVFHNEMNISEYKETALYCYWILKLRPFWVPFENKFSETINERFALYLYTMQLRGDDMDFSYQDGIDQAHVKELLYSFRFRDLSKESLILMLEPYYYKRLKKADKPF